MEPIPLVGNPVADNGKVIEKGFQGAGSCPFRSLAG
jgi:hypothetical protein